MAQVNTALNSISKYVCEIVLVICLISSYNFQVKEKNYESIIRSDGLGYYSYLPATFIYNDYKYTFLEKIKKTHPDIVIGDGFLNKTDDGTANKYFVGLGLLLLPFFIVAHFFSYLFGFPTDGYSSLYHLFVLLAANFYLWLGCRYTRKMILKYPLSQSAAAFIVLLIVFGTNLFFYTTVDSCFTHVYSFAIIVSFLYFSDLFFMKKEPKHLCLVGFLFGLIILLRPTNAVIILMLPFLAGSFKGFIEAIKNIKGRVFILSFMVFIFTIFIQLLLYYLQSGHLIVWSYGEERFYFNNPQIFNVLFSYRKGLFIYTPLVLVSLGGLFYLFKQNKFQFFTIVLFMVVCTYVISCWWCWWYGGSLGQRAFVDFYSILALLLAFLYLNLRTKLFKGIFYFATLFFVVYSLILTYQYRHYIIDYTSMNQRKFWFTFLQTGAGYEGLTVSEGLFDESQPTNIISLKASNGRYLSCGKDPENSIKANNKKDSSWESFNVIQLSGNKVAIRSDDKSYFSTRLDKENKILHAANDMNKWEQFELIYIKKNTAILKAFNNKFVVLKGEDLFASADRIEDAEQFYIKRK